MSQELQMSKKSKYEDSAHETRRAEMFVKADQIEAFRSRECTSRLEASCLELSRERNMIYWDEPLEKIIDFMIRHPDILEAPEKVLEHCDDQHPPLVKICRHTRFTLCSSYCMFMDRQFRSHQL